MTLGAGALSHRVRVERRGAASNDGLGNVLEPWTPLVIRWAGLRPEFGREALAAGRLESTARGTLTLRRDPATAAITGADRVVFLTGPWSGRLCNILSIVPTLEEIEMTIETGVAT